MSEKSWMKDSIDDLVFQDRNKEYGAYYLRRIYDKYMSRGMLTGLLGFLFIIFGPQIYAKFQELVAAQEEEFVMKEVTLAEPPPIDPKKIPPPPPPKIDPPPIKDQIKFVPPKVMKDEKVVEEEPPPTVEEIKDKEIATETKKGEEDGVDASLVEPDAPPPPPPPPPPVVEEDPDEKKVYDFVAQKPEFPDGDKALFKFLGENIKYPAIARENGIEGRVIVKFVVSRDGSIQNASVVRGIGGGCDEEALRVVKSMPKWKPGKNNGKPVNVTYTLPVSFKLEG
jgi:periplasmic protein TonB